jgi:hypothetical protein
MKRSMDIDQMKRNLKSAVALIEKDRQVHAPDCTVAYAPTGDYFLTWVSGGLKHEGAAIGIWCTSPETALTWMLRHILNYKENHPGVIYWRQRPTINVENFLKPVGASLLALHQETTMSVYSLYFAWCRLVISDSPILDPKDLEKLRGGRYLEQPNTDTHCDTPQPDEGRGDGKLEGN